MNGEQHWTLPKIIWWIVGTGVGILTSWFALFELILPLFEDEQANTVTLTVLNDCRSGDLATLGKDAFDPTKIYTYTEGAGRLRICASREVSAVPSLMAATVAETFEGCLSFSDFDDTFTMVPNPLVVCREDVGAGVRYYCDGERAADPKLERNVVQLSELPRC